MADVTDSKRSEEAVTPISLATERLKNFYDGGGWRECQEGHTQDALLFEDLRKVSQKYVSSCRRRLLPFLAGGGQRILDAASGPIQYPEYLEYSLGFARRVCVDISESALAGAAAKMGHRGEYVRSSLETLPFADDVMDATVSLHTIYHIDQGLQAAAVRELIRVTKVNAPLLIVYSNPFPWHARVVHFFEKLFWERPRLLRGFRKLIGRDVSKIGEASIDDQLPLYFFPHPLEWWTQFCDQCHVEIQSWRFLTADESRKWIPNNLLGSAMLLLVTAFERFLPKTSARWCAYPLIVLKKKE